jgi:hypothetical protein
MSDAPTVTVDDLIAWLRLSPTANNIETIYNWLIAAGYMEPDQVPAAQPDPVPESVVAWFVAQGLEPPAPVSKTPAKVAADEVPDAVKEWYTSQGLEVPASVSEATAGATALPVVPVDAPPAQPSPSSIAAEAVAARNAAPAPGVPAEAEVDPVSGLTKLPPA